MSTRTPPKRVLGCDPGYERLGVAVIERDGGREKLLYSACLRTPVGDAFAGRLRSLGEAFDALLLEHLPEMVALESVFLARNQKTAMQVAEVRGMLTYLAAKRDIPVVHYAPPEVKVAVTGHGGSDKRQVALMVERLISLPEKKRIDDEVDAIAVALTCLAHTRSGVSTRT